MSESSPGLEPGTVVAGKYRLERLLGCGGMGAVYAAEHLALGKQVAIKLMRPEFAANPRVRERFYREARIAAATGHDGVVGVHDIGEDDQGRHFMVMDLLPGENLHEYWVARGRRLDGPEAVAIVCAVLDALEAVHRHGVVHRDIKPENIFLCQSGEGPPRIKILDFGISRDVASEAEAGRLTQTGAIIGTPHFVSPEQAEGASDVDARADVYACGVILYQLLTGELPFRGDTVPTIFVAILTGTPQPLASYGLQLPPNLEEVVARAMARDRDARFASAAELRAALTPFLAAGAAPVLLAAPTQPDGHTPFGPATAPAWGTGGTLAVPQPGRRWGLIAAVAAACVAGVVVAIVMLASGPPSAGGDTDAPPAADHARASAAATPTDPIPLEAPAAPSAAVAPAPDAPAPNAPAAASAQPAPPSPVAAGGAAAAAPDEVAPPTHVTVSLDGAPDGVEIFLAAARLAPPIRLPRGERPVALRLACAGFRDQTVWVVPSRDLTLPVRLEPLPSEPTRASEARAAPDKRAASRRPPRTKRRPKPAPAPAPEPTPPAAEPAPKPPAKPAPADPAPKFELDLDYGGSSGRKKH